MLRPLKRHEKESLRSRLLERSVLFKAFQAPIREMEVAAKGFRLAPEEVFWQVTIVLDVVKEQQEDCLLDIRSLWNNIFADYRDLSGIDEGIEDFASLTVFCIQICLAALDEPLYRTMAAAIGEQLALRNQPTQRTQASVLNNIARIDIRKFKAAVQAYMNSDEEWLSDEIVEVLEDTPNVQMPLPEKKEETETKSPQLTNRQLMILFDLFLNKGFSPDYCNQDALAKLLSQVSGRSKGSIRQKIREGVDYETEEARNDVKLLATLLEPVDATLATKMRNLIE